MKSLSFRRLAIAAFAGLIAVSPIAAQAQSRVSYINNRISQITYDSPGSRLVFDGCLGVADRAYNRSGRTGDGLLTLAGCSAIGCGLMPDYAHCIRTGAQLFLLRVERRFRAGY